MKRIATHREISSEVAALSDDDLLRWLSDPELVRIGHGSRSLPKSGTAVFVKLLPLTAVELDPHRKGSTENLFDLPPYYHYRLGSSGFGAWRELSAHQLANRWVLSGACPGFPLLHGWRVIPLAHRGSDDRMETEQWRDHPAICRRIAALTQSTWSAVLILEQFPSTAAEWLRLRLARAADPLAVIEEVESALGELLAFIGGNDLLHLDAHLENVLSDGTSLFLTDFGLSLSTAFRLKADERAFQEHHRNFDRCTVAVSLAHALVSQYDTRDAWREALCELVDDTHRESARVSPEVRTYLASRRPLVLEIGEFYRSLGSDLTAEYPASRLDTLMEGGAIPNLLSIRR